MLGGALDDDETFVLFCWVPFAIFIVVHNYAGTRVIADRVVR